ncbi:hypothetical protein ACQV2B_02730 [Pantoea allii]|uniref:hypothetical protein n=1 Tax=Pantoea allii TaxID=574096 RepID=UPI003D3151B6
MIKVKRYDPEVYACEGLGRPGIMCESVDGGYVDYEDYEAVKAKSEALQDLWERIFINVPHFRTSMEKELTTWTEENRSLSDKLANEWLASEEEHQLREMGFSK